MSRPKTLKIRHRNSGRAFDTPDDQINALLYPERDFWRPRVREDCAEIPRPCPYVGCRHHMYLDVDNRAGTIRFNYPDKEPWELNPDESCSLDIVDKSRADLTLLEIGEIMCLTRERVRQIESVAQSRMKRSQALHILQDIPIPVVVSDETEPE
jgi:hypothetical protein